MFKPGDKVHHKYYGDAEVIVVFGEDAADTYANIELHNVSDLSRWPSSGTVTVHVHNLTLREKTSA